MATATNTQEFERFASDKRALTETIGKKHGIEVSAQVKKFFDAVEAGDWATTSNLFYKLEAGNRQQAGVGWSPPPFWGAIHDTFGVYELINGWNAKYLDEFGRAIVRSIPPGSIYFGGTDGGRFAVSLFCEHTEGRPFFTLTQNALADNTYLGYLNDMYGGRIYIAGTDDSQRCFQEYLQDAQARLKHDQEFPNEPRQIRPGEDVRIVNNRVQVTGQIAVMAINGLLARVIFEKNPDREFYIEESFPLDWMYPYLTPHQFIFKLNRETQNEIPVASVRSDREFWQQKTDGWLGGWLVTNTAVAEIADFAERVYLKADLKKFGGEREFIRDLDARKAFSKLRSSIGGMYAWRATHATDLADRKRMNAEADFAFRQAFAICPVSPEAVFRYVSLLIGENRLSDAAGVAATARKLDPENKQVADLYQQILAMKRQKGGPPPTK